MPLARRCITALGAVLAVAAGLALARAEWRQAEIVISGKPSGWFLRAPSAGMAKAVAHGGMEIADLRGEYPDLPEDCDAHIRVAAVTFKDPDVERFKHAKRPAFRRTDRQDRSESRIFGVEDVLVTYSPPRDLVLDYGVSGPCPPELMQVFDLIAKSLSAGKAASAREAQAGKVRSVQSKRTQGEARASEGLASILDGQLLTARDSLEQSVRLHPKGIRGQVASALLLRLRGDEPDWRKLFEKAVRSDPKTAQTWRSAFAGDEQPIPSVVEGLDHEARGNAAGALEAYNLAVTKARDRWLGYALRGIYRAGRGECREGSADLDKAVDLNPLFGPQARSFTASCRPPAR